MFLLFFFISIETLIVSRAPSKPRGCNASRADRNFEDQATWTRARESTRVARDHRRITKVAGVLRESSLLVGFSPPFPLFSPSPDRHVFPCTCTCLFRIERVCDSRDAFSEKRVCVWKTPRVACPAALQLRLIVIAIIIIIIIEIRDQRRR